MSSNTNPPHPTAGHPNTVRTDSPLSSVGRPGPFFDSVDESDRDLFANVSSGLFRKHVCSPGCWLHLRERGLARSRPKRSGVHSSLDPAARMGRPQQHTFFRTQTKNLTSGIEVRIKAVATWNHAMALHRKNRELQFTSVKMDD